MLGSLDHVTRQLIVHTSPTKRSSDFVAHLEQLDRLFGPRPGQPTKPVVLVEDNGPIHTSKLSMTALAARAHWLTVEWLPKYAPELNDIEAGLARPQGASPGTSDVCRRRRSGPRDPPGRGRTECRAHGGPVGRVTNFCLDPTVVSPAAKLVLRRFRGRVRRGESQTFDKTPILSKVTAPASRHSERSPPSSRRFACLNGVFAPRKPAVRGFFRNGGGDTTVGSRPTTRRSAKRGR